MGTVKDAAGVAKDLLNRKETGPGPHPPRTMDHLALAIMIALDADLPDALSALQNLRRAFVDWNELRVARVQELARELASLPEPEETAKRLKDEYNAFFEKKGALNYEFLAAGKPAESRRALQQLLPVLGKGAAAILLYEFCPGATLPLSDEGLKQARRDGAVGKQGDRNMLSRVLLADLEPSEAATLLQYWELEGTGSPYGEPIKKDAPKKGRKPAAKAKSGKK